MKKLFSFLLCITMVTSLAACGGTGGATQDSAVNNGKTTLMIYMIGSDLESKNGAATDDLIEIQESGVDTDKNDVVVCTGGSPEWQNDAVNSEKNMILTLSEDGYDEERSAEPASMGEAESLTRFLDYCVKNHPAEHYALILWNHGNGPLIGYGKDMLFDSDSLTLTEMQQAMEQSPFSQTNKLDWVGFDACLMASAELSCVWAPYANYLVASQEVEPAFGWQYSFLENMGKKDPQNLIETITEKYLGACLEYFEKKDYNDRDTTLACVDLSYADELGDAVNGLFEAAAGNVEKHYDELTALRVNTRALGRASTGSEYDLVDLNDLSKQLEKDYPAQSKALSDVIGKMVVSNATNAQGLSGMSLYYPFYNKNYYENEWCETYREMNVFPEYLNYLAKYEKFWLGSDLEADYAVSKMPEAESKSKYTLQLTEDQAQHYASATYYILKKEGKETFTKIYSSGDVSYSDGKLSADFDGNVIYAHNDLDEYILPVATEHDTVGDNTHYSVKVVLTNKSANRIVDDVFSGNEQEEKKTQGCRFLISANSHTSEINVSGLLPNDKELEEGAFSSGKLEEIDLSDYTTYNFYAEPDRTLTRNEKGVVNELNLWQDKGNILWNEMTIGDGLDFVYAPLAYGEYALVFEICDTQNNRYCSEPIDIDTSGVDWLKQKENDTQKNKDTIRVASEGKYPLLIKEDKDFALYLDRYQDVKEVWYQDEKIERDFLTLYAVNKTDKKLSYTAKKCICNGTIDCSDGSGVSAKIMPGAKEQAGVSYDDYPSLTDQVKEAVPDYTPDTAPNHFDFGLAFELGKLKKLSSMRFVVSVNSYEDDKTIWNELPVEITFAKGSEYEIKDEENKPTAVKLGALFDAVVPAQTVCEEKDRYRVELLQFGTENESYFKAYYHIKNLSDSDVLYLTSDGFAVDDIFIDKSFSGCELEPGTECYRRVTSSVDDLSEKGITGMQKLSVSVRTNTSSTFLWQGFGDVRWSDLKLTKKSSAPSKFKAGSKVLMDEHDVRLAFADYETKDYSTKKDGSDLYKYWYLTLENKGKDGVQLGMKDIVVNGKPYTNDVNLPIYLSDSGQAGPGQSTVLTFVNSSSSRKIADVKTLSFIPVIYDFTGEKILFTGSKPIELKAE